MTTKTIILLNPPGDKLYSRDKYCTSISKSDYYWPPLDLVVVSGILSGEYRVVVIDAIAENISFKDCFKKIISLNPHAIFFVTCSATWKNDFELIQLIKENNPLTLMIASGGFLLSCGEEILEKVYFIDAILLDFTSSELLTFLKHKSAEYDLIYRSEGNIVKCPRKKIKEFSYPPPPHHLFPLKQYRYPLGTRAVYTCVITSFGCPFSCYFCVPRLLGYKQRNIDNVLEELHCIEKSGIKEIVFQDSTFTAQKHYTRELCERMIKENINLKWLCLTRVDTVDEELLKLMKKAGCHTIEFGVESGNNDILNMMCKGITKDQIRSTFALCKRIGIRACGFFILGLPEETEKTIRETIDFAKEIDCYVASFSIPMPHPGTGLCEIIKGDSTPQLPEHYDDSSMPAYETPELTRGRLWELRNQAYQEFYFRPSYIMKRVFSLKSWYQWRIECAEFIALLKSLIKKSS